MLPIFGCDGPLVRAGCELQQGLPILKNNSIGLDGDLCDTRQCFQVFPLELHQFRRARHLCCHGELYSDFAIRHDCKYARVVVDRGPPRDLPSLPERKRNRDTGRDCHSLFIHNEADKPEFHVLELRKFGAHINNRWRLGQQRSACGQDSHKQDNTPARNTYASHSSQPRLRMAEMSGRVNLQLAFSEQPAGSTCTHSLADAAPQRSSWAIGETPDVPYCGSTGPPGKAIGVRAGELVSTACVAPVVESYISIDSSGEQAAYVEVEVVSETCPWISPRFPFARLEPNNPAFANGRVTVLSCCDPTVKEVAVPIIWPLALKNAIVPVQDAGMVVVPVVPVTDVAAAEFVTVIEAVSVLPKPTGGKA